MVHIKDFLYWVNESSEYSLEDTLRDIDRAYELGLIDKSTWLREKIKSRHEIEKTSSLTSKEVESLDPELAEEINNYVQEEAFDWAFKFGSPEEHEAWDKYTDDLFFDTDWAAYQDGTLDVQLKESGPGTDKMIRWTDSDGNEQSKYLLNYFKGELEEELDPHEVTGKIIPWKVISKRIIELFREL
jgi:hypothetical protein